MPPAPPDGELTFWDIAGIAFRVGAAVFGANIISTATAVVDPPLATSVNVGNLSGRIKALVDYTIQLNPAPGINATTGICMMQYDPDVIGNNGDIPLGPDGKPKPGVLSDSITANHAFITLQDLTTLINAIVQKTAPATFHPILCDPSYPSRPGQMPKTVTPAGGTAWRDGIELVSADPGEIVFPGYAAYSFDKGPANSATEKQNFNLDEFIKPAGAFDYATQFIAGSLAFTLINVEFLERIFSELGSDTTKGQQSADETFSALFSKIFQSIYNNSGNRFQLSLVTNPGNTNQILMVDVNYVNAGPSVFTLQAVTDGGFCRSISLASKVPQEAATIAMVAASSTATKSDPSAVRLITSKDAPAVAQPAIATMNEALEAVSGGTGFTQTNIEGLRSAMQDKKVKGLKSDSNAIIYPIEFSATMDGVEGFVFGNTVKCNYLPEAMLKNRIVHTILNVDHDISNSDWTTSITTVCRVLE